jgi:CBS domain containing-hemolysin-like protein
LLFAAEPTSAIPPEVGLVLIPILIALNAFFVAAEFALVAVRKTRVEELVNQGAPRSQALLEAVKQLDDSVAAAQLGITFASLALGLVSEPALAVLLHPLFAALPAHWQGPFTHALAVVVTLLLVTYLHVVFGEQMPKLAALRSAERVALLVAVPLRLFARLTRPLVWAMNESSALFLRLLRVRPAAAEENVHSVEELGMLVEDTEEAGLIDPESADFVLNVFALSDKTVRDVMVPWDRVMALELTTPPDKILEAVREGAHTRMPVYEGSKDDIVGIVNTKDLFFLFSLRGIVNLDDARYDALFLPPDAPVSVALRLFRKTRRPMAVVRDKDGTVLGILTLEDVLEEIVGDIEDEQDDPARRRELVAKYLRRGGPPKPPGK